MAQDVWQQGVPGLQQDCQPKQNSQGRVYPEVVFTVLLKWVRVFSYRAIAIVYPVVVYAVWQKWARAFFLLRYCYCVPSSRLCCLAEVGTRFYSYRAIAIVYPVVVLPVLQKWAPAFFLSRYCYCIPSGCLCCLAEVGTRFFLIALLLLCTQ